jgi:accessory colonization factor AcfC
MGLNTFLHHPSAIGNATEYRNDQQATAQINMRLSQAQYKQVAKCSSTSAVWSTLTQIYEQTAESKASSLFLQFIQYQKKSNQSMKATWTRW